MLHLYLENVRTFSSPQSVPIAPITFLVGENSSGKTTFLATLAAALRSKSFPVSPDFNEPPYNLGGFHTIATYKGGRFGRAQDFTFGIGDKSSANPFRLRAAFDEWYGQPRLRSIESQSARGSVVLDRHDSQITGVIRIQTSPNASTELPVHCAMPSVDAASRSQLNDAFFSAVWRSIFDPKKGPPKFAYREIQSILRPGTDSSDPISIAPIRSRPERTYDQPSEVYDPEGNHVPYVLARAFDGEMPERDREQLIASLREFGEGSGLFRAIKIKRLGHQPGSPFKLMVVVGSQPRELLDVGYGVSQALPIAVQALMADRRRLLLLQQPEVHLHPRAQAAFGSLLVSLHVSEQKKFVIETHSDYVMDRVRQHIRAGDVPADNVLILYFERDKYDTKVWPLKIDSDGNVNGTPPSYRSFFLREQERLLF